MGKRCFLFLFPINSEAPSLQFCGSFCFWGSADPPGGISGQTGYVWSSRKGSILVSSMNSCRGSASTKDGNAVCLIVQSFLLLKLGYWTDWTVFLSLTLAADTVSFLPSPNPLIKLWKSVNKILRMNYIFSLFLAVLFSNRVSYNNTEELGIFVHFLAKCSAGLCLVFCGVVRPEHLVCLPYALYVFHNISLQTETSAIGRDSIVVSPEFVSNQNALKGWKTQPKDIDWSLIVP